MPQLKKKRVFAGSKPSGFYDEGYYMRGEGSNYGRKDAAGKLVFAPYEENSYLPRNRQLAKFVVDVYKPKTVLVLGCARAYLVQAFAELGVNCEGIDISKWAIEHAPEKIRDRLYVGDICNLWRWKDRSVDCVVGLDVFEHIRAPDLFTAIEEARRVCKKTLIIDVPLNPDDLHPDQSEGTDKSHVSVYSEAFWLKQFSTLDLKLDGKDVYTYPEGNQGGTFIFKRISQSAVLQQVEMMGHCKIDTAITINTGVPSAGEIKYPLAERKRVDIILLNYNGLKFTPKCIETLYKNTDYNVQEEVITKIGREKRVELGFNLIVVDNQSTDGSAEYLNFASQSYPNMHVCYLKQLNSGFAEGVNVGLKESTAPYVLLLNNDTVFTQKNWLSLLVEALEKDPCNGIVSPKLLYPDGRIQYAGASFGVDMQPYHLGRFKNAECFSVEREVPWATFACVLLRRELLQEGLDEAYKLGTFEDVDFCCKARFDGWKIRYVPACRVYHYEGASVFTLNKVHFSQQQMANANLFYMRWREWLRLNRAAYPEVYNE